MGPRRQKSESPEDYPETQFISLSDDDVNLWEVSEILDERGPPARGDYLVKWKGVDPDTGESWPPSWTAKEGCTQGLIDDWKEKKRDNPTIVGKEGKRLSEAEKAKKKRKRNRDSITDIRVKREKPDVRAAKIPARTTRSKDETTSISKSPDFPDAADFPEPVGVNAPGPSSRTLRRSKSVSSTGINDHDHTPAGRVKKRVRVQSRDTYDESSSPEPEFISPPVSSRATSKTRSSPSGRSKVNQKVVVDLSTHHASPGPGPSTAAHRSKEASPPKTSRTPLRPVPVPSPSLFKSHMKAAGRPPQTQTSGSNLDSQAESIRQFSSSPPPSATSKAKLASKARKSRSTPSQEDSQGEDAIDKTDKQPQPASSPQRVVNKVNDDGDIVTCAKSDSEDGSEADEGDQASKNVEVQVDVDDDDLNDLNSDAGDRGDQEVDMGGGMDNSEATESTSLHQCLWKGCTVIAEDAESLSKHVRGHAGEIDVSFADNALTSTPRHKSASPPSPALTPPPAVTEPHPDTAELADARAKISQLEVQLEEATKALSAVAAQSHPPAQTEPEASSAPNDDIEELRADIKRLGRARKTLQNDNNFLRDQYSSASDRAVMEVRAAEELRDQVKTLKSQLTLGLKQRSFFSQKIASDHKDETRKLRAQLKILVDQSKKTDDQVRMKATFYDQYKEEYENLIDQLRKKDGKIQGLEERNTTLIDQLETLRAIQMGIITGDESQEEETDASDEETDRSSSPLGALTLGEIPSSRRAAWAGQQSLPTRTSSNVLSEASRVIETVRETPGFVCAWRNGDEQCRVISDTVEELHDHVSIHAQTEFLEAQG